MICIFWDSYFNSGLFLTLFRFLFRFIIFFTDFRLTNSFNVSHQIYKSCLQYFVLKLTLNCFYGLNNSLFSCRSGRKNLDGYGRLLNGWYQFEKRITYKRNHKPLWEYICWDWFSERLQSKMAEYNNIQFAEARSRLRMNCFQLYAVWCENSRQKDTVLTDCSRHFSAECIAFTILHFIWYLQYRERNTIPS